jgi:hypothetical protein
VGKKGKAKCCQAGVPTNVFFFPGLYHQSTVVILMISICFFHFV